MISKLSAKLIVLLLNFYINNIDIKFAINSFPFQIPQLFENQDRQIRLQINTIILSKSNKLQLQNNKQIEKKLILFNKIFNFKHLQQQMELNDFKGLNYFRFLVPTFYVSCWVSMIVGPAYFTLPYRQFCFIIYIHFFLKAVYQLSLTISMCIRGNAALERAKNPNKNPRPLQAQYQEVYHAFVIPSYKEDIELLAETIGVLAQHTRAASTYLVFLAMEEHEQDSDVKARQLMARFQSKFRSIDFTRHKIRPNEQKGKASNVSWCVEHMEDKFNALMINPEDVFVTIMDADSWAPNAYINELQDHLFEHLENRHLLIYQPTQIFTRNDQQVSVFIRTYDDMYSSFHAAANAACCGPTFMLSNYTMSYSLIKRVGYWDTIEEAIAQDFHMLLKTHFKTQGQTITVPIYTAFNQLSIQTGNGYTEDLKAKFWQLERHGRALLDMGYSILMFFRYSSSCKSFLVLVVITENFLLPIIVPSCVFAIQIQDRLLGWEAPTEGLLQPMNFFILLSITNLLAVIMTFVYDYYKRKSSKILWGIEGPSLWKIIEAPLCIFINCVVVLTITYITSSFNGLKKNREYVVADKKSAVPKMSSEEIEGMIQDVKIIQPQDQKAALLVK